MGRKFWGLYVIRWGIATFGVKSVVRKKIFWGKFLPKIRNFRDFELLVLRNPSTTQNFVKIVQRPAGISRLSGQKCGNTAPKTVKISNFGHIFVPHGRLVSIFLRNSQHVYASIGSF